MLYPAMPRSVKPLISLWTFLCIAPLLIPLGNAPSTLHAETPENIQAASPYEPFTGKITRNKVRMRLQPSLDALILTELNRDTLLSIVGEEEEFYAILPLKDTKAYIFRTLVLDGVVEGNRVNVRLEPALEAPVIAQLNQGDRIEGNVSALNSKWLEISPPGSTRFYVCKEYVDKVGGPGMIKELETRSAAVQTHLRRIFTDGKREMRKNFAAIDWESIASAFHQFINQYPDFPTETAQAEELLASMQKSYLQKKVAYLESLVNSREGSTSDAARNGIASEETPASSAPTAATAAHAQEEEQLWNTLFDPTTMPAKMGAWIPIERALYDQWASNTPAPSPYQFYQQQTMDQVPLRGLVETYARVVRNKPGDFLLVNQSTNRPIAYIYSTKINLQEKVGHEVTLYGAKRANNNFAFPAYYILSIER